MERWKESEKSREAPRQENKNAQDTPEGKGPYFSSLLCISGTQIFSSSLYMHPINLELRMRKG